LLSCSGCSSVHTPQFSQDAGPRKHAHVEAGHPQPSTHCPLNSNANQTHKYNARTRTRERSDPGPSLATKLLVILCNVRMFVVFFNSFETLSRLSIDSFAIFSQLGPSDAVCMACPVQRSNALMACRALKNAQRKRMSKSIERCARNGRNSNIVFMSKILLLLILFFFII
jgi:hypothetical protein